MNDKITKISNWRVCYPMPEEHPYRAPEQGPRVIVGTIEGTRAPYSVYYNDVFKVSGRMAFVKGGKVVILGEVDPGYREWLRENRPSWDPETPLPEFLEKKAAKKSKFKFKWHPFCAAPIFCPIGGFGSALLLECVNPMLYYFHSGVTALLMGVALFLSLERR